MTLVHHIHRDHYVTELGRKGAVAALVAETLPLKLLYRGAPFLTISESAKRDIVDARRSPPDDVHVGYLGVVPFPRPRRARSETPRLLYLGPPEALQADRAAARRARGRSRAPCSTSRATAITGRRWRHEIAAPRARRARRPARARLRGGEGGAVRARVGQPHRLLGRGLVPDGDGGRDVRHAERGAPRRRAAGVDRRRLDRAARRRRAGPDRRGAAPRGRRRRCARAWAPRRSERARDVHVGAHRARVARRCSRRPRARAGARCATSLPRSETLKAAGMAAATMANNALALRLHGAVRADPGRDGLRLAGRAGLDVRDPLRARARRCRSRWRARSRWAGSARAGSSRRRCPCGEDGCWWPASRSRRAPCCCASRSRDLISVPEEWAAAAARPDRRPVAAAVGRARRAAGRAPLQAGGVVDRAGGGRAA